MISTELKDKNGNEIFVGSIVAFKFYGHQFTQKVHKTRNGYYPFDDSINVEVGFYIQPNECEIISQIIK